MASLGQVGQLSESEYADLEERVDRFFTAWSPDGSIDILSFLPPVGAAHRLFVLVELIKVDMERRAKACMPFRIDSYLERFSAEIPKQPVPVSLLAEEYRLRHRYADKPSLEDYRTRYPSVIDELAKQILHHSIVTPTRESKTIGTEEFDDANSLKSTGELQDIPLVKATIRETSRETPGSTPRHSKRGLREQRLEEPVTPFDTLPAELEYKLLKRLGKGSFGEVYDALAPGGFRVAIKRILRSVDHPSSIGEVESLEVIKSMSHPFLVQTHAYWVFKDRLVIVMELADGSLADRVSHHQGLGHEGVPPEELIPYFEQAAQALDYLHAQNVSHRDIKPENLLVLQGYAKVADFGLAREHTSTMTEIGMEIGTPMYMAPEVWRRKMSLHSDQYSLAGTYVTARLGRPPYPAKSIAELFIQHLEETPNLGDLPPKEKAVILKAMSKSPDDRYPSCVAFAAALREAVLDPPPTRTRRKSMAIVVLALTLGLAIGVYAALVPPSPAPISSIPEAPTPWQPAEWSPVADAGTTSASDGKIYFNRLSRTVARETIVAILVTPARPDDPPPFYMTRDKITNRVFKHVWEQAEKDEKSAFHRVLDIYGNEAKSMFPGSWKVGAASRTGVKLGIEGDQAGVPVVGTTLPEAKLVAEELGGKLPTYQHWSKAVGAAGDGPQPGPAGKKETKEENLSLRPLALGLKNGPWPIEKQTTDLSVYGIHQLTSNGFEWTEGKDESSRINLLQRPSSDIVVRIVGRSWEDRQVQTFARIADDKLEWNWTDVTELYGCRLVLMPR